MKLWCYKRDVSFLLVQFVQFIFGLWSYSQVFIGKCNFMLKNGTLQQSSHCNVENGVFSYIKIACRLNTI